MRLTRAVFWSWFSFGFCVLALAWDSLAFLGHVVRIPAHPLTHGLWATFFAVLVAILGYCVGLNWRTLALHRGPRGVRVRRANGEVHPVEVTPMGIDDDGSYMWMVMTNVNDGDQLLIRRMPPQTSIYYFGDPPEDIAQGGSSHGT